MPESLTFALMKFTTINAASLLHQQNAFLKPKPALTLRSLSDVMVKARQRKKQDSRQM